MSMTTSHLTYMQRYQRKINVPSTLGKEWMLTNLSRSEPGPKTEKEEAEAPVGSTPRKNEVGEDSILFPVSTFSTR